MEIERDAAETTTTKASADLRWLTWVVFGHDLVFTVSLFATACAAAGTITAEGGSWAARPGWSVVGNFTVACGMLASFSVMLSLYFSATAAKQMYEEALAGFASGIGGEEHSSLESGRHASSAGSPASAPEDR